MSESSAELHPVSVPDSTVHLTGVSGTSRDSHFSTIHDLAQFDSRRQDPLTPSDAALVDSLVRSLIPTRQSILGAMEYCINRSFASGKIVELILSAKPFLIDAEIARVYLLSDLLYNAKSDRKGAWTYRSAIERVLPSLFCHLHGCLTRQANTSLMHARLLSKVGSVLNVWDSWAVFDATFIECLRFQFIHGRDAMGDYQPLTLPESDDETRRDMRLYGLHAVGDGSDYAFLEYFKIHVLGHPCDIDGLSLTADDLDEQEHGDEEVEGTANPTPGRDVVELPEPMAPTPTHTKIQFNLSMAKRDTPTLVLPVVAPVACTAVVNLDDFLAPVERAIDPNPIRRVSPVRRSTRTRNQRHRSRSRSRERPRRQRSRERSPDSRSPVIRRYRYPRR